MLSSFIGLHGYLKDTPESLAINIIQRETIICVLNTSVFFTNNQPYNISLKNRCTYS